MARELSAQIGADKSEGSDLRNGYSAGYRPQRFNTRMKPCILLFQGLTSVGIFHSL